MVQSPLITKRSRKTVSLDANQPNKKIIEIVEHFECITCSLDVGSEDEIRKHMTEKHNMHWVINTIKIMKYL